MVITGKVTLRIQELFEELAAKVTEGKKLQDEIDTQKDELKSLMRMYEITEFSAVDSTDTTWKASFTESTRESLDKDGLIKVYGAEAIGIFTKSKTSEVFTFRPIIGKKTK